MELLYRGNRYVAKRYNKVVLRDPECNTTIVIDTSFYNYGGNLLFSVNPLSIVQGSDCHCDPTHRHSAVGSSRYY